MSKSSKDIAVKSAVALVVGVLSYVAARHSIDFSVYYITARTMLFHSGPLYGPQSGLGYPLVYRYPPLFLLLFVPFVLLPLKSAAFVWAVLKFAVLYYLARALFSRLGLSDSVWLRWLALLPSLPYLAVEFHYGNAEFFAFALVAAALLLVESNPVLAALSLALGISIKVWPLFFLPYLLAGRYTRVVGLALAFAVGFAFLPAGYFGWRGNEVLLQQWAAQEFGVASAAGEPGIITFPSQSLHGELMRYLVSLDYSKLPDTNYPKFNLLALDARKVQWLWVVLAASGYAGLLLLARRRTTDAIAIDAVAFCGLALLEPFTQNTDLVVLLWPITVAAVALYCGGHMPGWSRAAIWSALSLMALQPLVPGSTMQRALHVLGVDFTVTSLLGIGLLGKCLHDIGSGGTNTRAGSVTHS